MIDIRKQEEALYLSCRWLASYWDVLGSHLAFFIFTGLPLLAAHLFKLNEIPFIPCLFLKYMGLPCPFCGYTRSFWAMANGNFAYAFANCPAAVGLYIACVTIFFWNTASFISGMQFRLGKRLHLHSVQPMFLFLFAMVLLNWVYRLAWHLK